MSTEPIGSTDAPPFPWRSAIIPSLRWGFFAALLSAFISFIPVVGYIYLMLASVVGYLVGGFAVPGYPSWPWLALFPLAAYTVLFGLFRFVHLFFLHYHVAPASLCSLRLQPQRLTMRCSELLRRVTPAAPTACAPCRLSAAGAPRLRRR